MPQKEWILHPDPNDQTLLLPELPGHQDQTKQLLKHKVQECQERQKKRHDHTSHERKPFQLGEAVLLDSQKVKEKVFGNQQQFSKF